VVPFLVLWSNHPHVKGEDPLLPVARYPDQCAANLWAALTRSGVDTRSFHGTMSWEKPGPNYAIRAQEVADWLAKPVAGFGKVQKFKGAEAFDKMKKTNGIVFFQNYWGPGRQGDHIDLWNGSRLTTLSSWLRIQTGISWDGVWSDYKKAQSIWFWPVR